MRTVEEAADRPYAYIICALKCVPEISTTPAVLAPLISKLAATYTAPSPAADRPSSSSSTSTGTSTNTGTTTFVLLQNGIGIEDDLLDVLGVISAPTAVISGCCWVDTTAVDGGRKIVQHGNERLVLGYHRPASPAAGFSEDAAKNALGELVALLRAGGSVVDAAPDADVARWRKVLW